tara:strand:+ start:9684 stop:10535 length:852 start_codon:yes stop_codon:yes gene_type:complete
MKKSRTKISFFSLFRDSESYLGDLLARIEEMEAITDAEFSYFFYENDSKDNTVKILNDWIKGKNGKFLSEDVNEIKYESTTEPLRVIKMARIRNKMAELGKPVDSDYCVVLDSDIVFDPNIVNQYLEYRNLNFSMLTPNIRQNVPCKMGSGDCDSYYDSWSLVDKDKNQCMTWSSNPFYRAEDRSLFEQGLPIEVDKSFGGFAFVKSEFFNQVNWFSNGQLEHWHFCDMLRSHAPIFFLPNITPQTYVEKSTWEHEDRVVNHQKHLLENKWNRFLWKTQTQNS